MNEMIKMVVVLTILSAASGFLLSMIKNSTAAQIEVQQLQFVKGPAIKNILDGAGNDPIADRFKIKDGEQEKSFFVGKFNGKANSIAFEASGKGFAGDIGVMVGINIDDDKIIGAAVTTHSETPGLGANAKDKPDFTAQFKGLPAEGPVNVTGDGGKINAMAGATITSRGVCATVTKALEEYKKLKPQVQEEIKKF